MTFVFDLVCVILIRVHDFCIEVRELIRRFVFGVLFNSLERTAIDLWSAQQYRLSNNFLYLKVHSMLWHIYLKVHRMFWHFYLHQIIRVQLLFWESM